MYTIQDYLPLSFFNFAAYCACISSVFKSFLAGFTFSSDTFPSDQDATSDAQAFNRKKYLLLRTDFLMVSCLICFDLAIDTASAFLVGGPTFIAVCVCLECERLDDEEALPRTMRGCW